jgi:hypothetical protein
MRMRSVRLGRHPSYCQAEGDVHCFRCREGRAAVGVTSYWQDNGLYRTCWLPRTPYTRSSRPLNWGHSRPHVHGLLPPASLTYLSSWVAINRSQTLPAAEVNVHTPYTPGCNTVFFCFLGYITWQVNCVAYVLANDMTRIRRCKLVAIWACFKVFPSLSGKRSFAKGLRIVTNLAGIRFWNIQNTILKITADAPPWSIYSKLHKCAWYGG